jgi:hypothetical protein
MGHGKSTIDLHPDRARIERDIALRVPIDKIAKKYGVSAHKITWHARHKMPAQLKAALIGKRLKDEVDLEKLRIEESEGLLANLAGLRARLLVSFDKAQAAGEHSAVATLGNQLHKNLQIVGDLLGEFASHQIQTNINILIQPEYMELRSGLIRILGDYPKAREAVLSVFQQIEQRAIAPPKPDAKMVK